MVGHKPIVPLANLGLVATGSVQDGAVTDHAASRWLCQDDELRLVARFGRDLHGWLDRGARRTAELAERWGVGRLGQPRAGGTSVLVEGRRGSTRVVLKLTPEPALGQAEGAALRHWEPSPHMVSLLAADDSDGALLLTRVEPGDTLAQTGWALPDVIPVLSDLFRPQRIPDGMFPGVEHRVRFLIQLTRSRMERLPATSGVLGIGLDAVQVRAIALARSYEGAPHLVHGDLHPGNVLRGATDGVVAIDPRACVGDPHFDLADWVLGPALPRDIDLRGRADELGRSVPDVDPDRAYAWAIALAPILAYSVAGDPSAEAQQKARELAALWQSR